MYAVYYYFLFEVNIFIFNNKVIVPLSYFNAARRRQQISHNFLYYKLC